MVREKGESLSQATNAEGSNCFSKKINNMEFKGRILKVMPVQTGSTANGEWRKQEFVFEYFEHDTDRWSDKVVLSVMNDSIEKYDLHTGDEVVIGFGHNYREWNGRYFNEVRMYKCEKVGGVARQPEQEKPAEQPKPQQAQMDFEEKGKDDDLPF